MAADRILVAGNSAFGIDAAGRGFIAAHTGRFLTGLRRRGLRPRLAQPGIPLPDAPHIFDYPLDGSGIDTCALDRTKRARAFLTVLRLCREADFAHLFFPGRMARWTAIACALAGTRYSLYVDGMKFSERGRDAWVLRRAEFILTVSPSLARAVGRFCKDVDTVSPMNGLAASDVRPRAPRLAPPDRWRLLCVCRLSEAKGVRELMAAADLLRQRGLRFTLTLVGGGDLHAELLDAAAALNARWADEVVTLTGVITDRHAMLDEYARADLFVLATHHEGFPRVLTEAMSTALPIITTMVGGIPGRMTDGVNCLAIPVGRPAAIADAVIRLTEDPALCRRIGDAGQATIAEVLRTHRPHDELFAERLRLRTRG